MKRDNMSESYSTTNLIINNIPASASDEQLNDLFCKFGTIKSYKVIRHNNEKDGKTYGFCEYVDPKSATKALTQLDNFRLNERVLRVSYAKLFPKPKGKSVGVCNIPKYMNEEVIRKYFSQFGRISRMRIKSSEGNCDDSKVAEIIYDNKSDAGKACNESQRCIQWDSKYFQVTVYMIDEGEKEGWAMRKNYGQNECGLGMYDDNYFYLLKSAAGVSQANAGSSLIQSAPPSTYATPYPFDLSAFQAALIYHQNAASQLCHNPTTIATPFSNGTTAATLTPLQYPPPTYPAYLSFQAPPNHAPYGAPTNTGTAAGVPISMVTAAAATGNVHGGHMAAAYGTNPSTNMFPSNTTPPPMHTLTTGLGDNVTNNNSAVNMAAAAGGGAGGYYGTLFQAPPQATAHHPQQQQHNQFYLHQHHPQVPTAASSQMMTPRSGMIQVKSVGGSQSIGMTTTTTASPPSSSTPPSLSSSQSHPYVVYVYNIGNNSSRDQLRELFSSPKYSQDIVKIDIPKEPTIHHNGMSSAAGLGGGMGNNKNFCFLTFTNYGSAKSAIDEMNGTEYQGKILQVSFKK